MQNSHSKLIREIAQNLDCGLDCYFNSETSELISIPADLEMVDDEESLELYKQDLQKATSQNSGFKKFQAPESFESFRIMERFVYQLEDGKLKSELEDALQRRKPFKNFKYLIDNSEYREAWFAFKQNELEKLIEEQL